MATSDRSRAQFPALPVLNQIASRLALHNKISWPDNVMIVAVQHLLDTTGSLFEKLVEMKLVSPKNLHVMGKSYSTNIDVVSRLQDLGIVVYENKAMNSWKEFSSSFSRDVEKMWDAIERLLSRKTNMQIIVLDDGGRCLSSVPRNLASNHRIIGIEQTTSGIYLNNNTVPVIYVASSAAKKYIEPPMIAEATFRKLCAVAPLSSDRTQCGVIGLGNIGGAVARGIQKMGHDVYIFDKDQDLGASIPGVFDCCGIEEVFNKANYIFGCTGEDILFQADWLNNIAVDKVLISCSSEDKEFLSLLKRNRETSSTKQPLFGTIRCKLDNCSMSIMRCGYPVNFDGSLESVPAMDIQMTRGLLFGAIIQALLYDSGGQSEIPNAQLLDPCLQKFVVHSWIHQQPRIASSTAPLLKDTFNDTNWIQLHSGGSYKDSEVMRDLFGCVYDSVSVFSGTVYRNFDCN